MYCKLSIFFVHCRQSYNDTTTYLSGFSLFDSHHSVLTWRNEIPLNYCMLPLSNCHSLPSFLLWDPDLFLDKTCCPVLLPHPTEMTSVCFCRLPGLLISKWLQLCVLQSGTALSCAKQGKTILVFWKGVKRGGRHRDHQLLLFLYNTTVTQSVFGCFLISYYETN